MNLLEEAAIVRDTYEVERFLGEGAFGQVYRVRHRFLKRREAMKLFKLPGMSVEEMNESLDEARLLTAIDHPNIVKVYDANTVSIAGDSYCYFTMEYVAGGSLQQFWSGHGSKLVPLEKTVEVARQIARGLAMAHREKPPIVHRDIKPGNILVGYDGEGLRARISDFGLAKRVNPLTLLASARGTPDFKPPEVFAQGDSCASDIWALGTTLYLLLTDCFPYDDMRRLQETNGKSGGKYRPAGRLNPLVDAGLERILERCLAIRREERYPTAVELLADLETWEPGQPAKADALARADTSSVGKTAMGRPLTRDSHQGDVLAGKAMEMARSLNRLQEAADLMEQAFNQAPALRDEHDWRLKLWRRGLMG